MIGRKEVEDKHGKAAGKCPNNEGKARLLFQNRNQDPFISVPMRMLVSMMTSAPTPKEIQHHVRACCEASCAPAMSPLPSFEVT